MKKKTKPNKKQKLSVTVQNFGKSTGQTYVADHRVAGSQILEVHATSQHLILGQSRIERHQLYFIDTSFSLKLQTTIIKTLKLVS